MVLAKINKAVFSAALLSLLSSTALATDIEVNTARMQAMDKITGRVSEVDVPINAPVKFGSFSILVRKCVTRPPEETPENTAFVDVVDDYNQKEPVNIFKGWMMSSSPALSAVEHPIYDVWLLKCFDKETNLKKLSAQELEARDEIRMVRGEKAPILKADAVSETDAETPAPTTNSDLESVVQATLALESLTPEAPKEVLPQQPEMVVVAPQSDALQDENAPVALFQIQEQQQPTAEPAPEVLPSAEQPEPQEDVSATDTMPEVLKVTAATAEAAVAAIEQPAPLQMELPLQPEISAEEQDVDEENGYTVEEYQLEQ